MQLKNPGKQRKRLFNAPAHIRHKMMGAPLSAELTASKGAKTLPVRKGDTVRIMRGDNKGFEGKISRVDLKRYRLYMEGLTREKVTERTSSCPFTPQRLKYATSTWTTNTAKKFSPVKSRPRRQPRKLINRKLNQRKLKKPPLRKQKKKKRHPSKKQPYLKQRKHLPKKQPQKKKKNQRKKKPHLKREQKKPLLKEENKFGKERKDRKAET